MASVYSPLHASVILASFTRPTSIRPGIEAIVSSMHGIVHVEVKLSQCIHPSLCVHHSASYVWCSQNILSNNYGVITMYVIAKPCTDWANNYCNNYNYHYSAELYNYIAAIFSRYSYDNLCSLTNVLGMQLTYQTGITLRSTLYYYQPICKIHQQNYEIRFH